MRATTQPLLSPLINLASNAIRFRFVFLLIFASLLQHFWAFHTEWQTNDLWTQRQPVKRVWWFTMARYGRQQFAAAAAAANRIREKRIKSVLRSDAKIIVFVLTVLPGLCCSFGLSLPIAITSEQSAFSAVLWKLMDYGFFNQKAIRIVWRIFSRGITSSFSRKNSIAKEINEAKLFEDIWFHPPQLAPKVYMQLS